MESPMWPVLYVVSHNDRWKIEAGAANLGPYSTRYEAIRAAIAAAKAAASRGQLSQVVAGTEAGNIWETVWKADASADPL